MTFSTAITKASRVASSGEANPRLAAFRELTAVVAATGLVALCAHISVALPFTPIPLTMQTFGVLLIGMLLGPFAGASAMLLYLAEGAVGLPVFSPHGPGGLAQLSGLSAGYLLSYPFAAWLAGRAFSKLKSFLPPFVAAFGAALSASGVILLSGTAWLMLCLHQSLLQAVDLGLVPFCVGETLKAVLLAAVIVQLQRTRIRT